MAKKGWAGVALPPKYANFVWKDHTNFPIPAGVAAQRIDQLKARYRGRIKPRHIVNDARPVNSVFHSCFEWNNAVAADQHRLTQAAAIIRGLCVVSGAANSAPVRYLYNVTVQPRRGRQKALTTYVGIQTATRVQAYRQEVFEDALSDLKSFAEKYSGFSRVTGVSLLLAGVNNLIQRARRLPIVKKRNR